MDGRTDGVKDMAVQLPGMARVRARFIEMLIPRHDQIAENALAAWDGESVDEITGNLSSAQRVLHQIAGTAGSLGFPELGAKASACENEIIAHLQGPDADLAICPFEVIQNIDLFLRDCRDIIEEQA